MRWIPILAATAALCAAAAADARADEPDDDTNVEPCFAAAESAQPLMKQHKLRGARARLEVCSRDVCPRLARLDCRRWLDEVERAIPSVVVEAREVRDGATVAVDDVRVVEDGVVVATRPGSTPLAFDPGSHVVRFERAGWPPVEKRFELAAGETRHVVEVTWDAAARPAIAAQAAGPVDAPSTGETAGRPAEAPAARPIPWSAWALAGAGVVAAGTGAYFELTGLARRGDLDASCRASRACSPSDVDGARDTMRIGDVTLGAGAVLLGAAVYVVLTRPTVAPRRVGVAFGPLPGGAFAGLGGAL
jgi:hypothetical protein